MLIDHTIEVSDEILELLSLEKGVSTVGSKEDQSALLRRIEELFQKEQKGAQRQKSAGVVHSSLGGSCCNTIRTMAAIGERVCFATNLAEDKEGRIVEEILGRESNLLLSIFKEKGVTGSTLVCVSPDGERTMHAQLGVALLLDKRAFSIEDLIQSQIYHFCGYQWGVFSQRKMIQDALVLAGLSKTLISFDPRRSRGCEAS